MPQTEIMVYRDEDGSTPLMEWLKRLARTDKKGYGKCLGRIALLSEHGFDLRRPVADVLRNHIYELRVRHIKIHYRMLYFFHGQNVVVISHGLAKEGEVPDGDIEFAIDCRRNVLSDPETYTAEFEV